MSTVFPIWILVSWLAIMWLVYQVLKVKRRLNTPMEVSFPNFGASAEEGRSTDDPPPL